MKEDEELLDEYINANFGDVPYHLITEESKKRVSESFGFAVYRMAVRLNDAKEIFIKSLCSN